jgi:Tfp pilus assembly protein PilN
VETEKILVQEKERALSFNQELEKEIKESNIFLSDLASFYEEHVEVTQLLEAVERTLPSGVYLTSFDFALPSTKSKGKSRISLNGFCPDRETLLSFQKNLKDEERFSEIYFSPQGWVKPENIDFNISLRFNEKI